MRVLKLLIAVAMAVALAVQSLSPLYAAVKRVESSALHAVSNAKHHHGVRLGMLWLRIITAIESEETPDEQAIASSPSTADDEDIVLVKRKRAIVRSKVSCRPYPFPHQHASLPETMQSGSRPDYKRSSASLSAIADETSGFFLKKSGLSPPFPFA